MLPLMLAEARKTVATYGRKMLATGLTSGTGGNLSVYDPPSGLMAISPSGMAYDAITPSDVVLVDLDGCIADAGPNERVPSTEVDLHRLLYRACADFQAVVHTHSTYATILATLRRPLPAANYYIALVGGPDVRCAEYATFGTPELGQAAVTAIAGRRACLLANHGLAAVGKTPADAFNVATEVERMAEIYYKASLLGAPAILDDAEVDRLLDRFASYGQKRNAG